MDYLDPKKKQVKRIKLLISYGLFGVLIAMGTILLFSLTTGFDVDRETGQLIQNGLIYIDSKPESAKIILNGQEQGSRTDARLIVPEGSYTVQLNRESYRPWERSVFLDPATVRRINYARLVPNQLDTELVTTLETRPDVASQSIDKRWIVFADNDDKLKMQVVDIESDPIGLQNIEFPLDFVQTREDGEWDIIEWADDHKVFLATYTTEDSIEYMLINRDKPLESIHLADVFDDVEYDDVTIRNRKNNLVFLHNSETGILSIGNVTTGLVEPLTGRVIQYNSFGVDVVYVTDAEAPKDKVRAVLKRGDDELTLRVLDKSKEYLLEMSKLGTEFVVGISSPGEGRVWVYKDPVAAASENEMTGIPVPTTVLRVEKPQELRISSDSSAITVRGDNQFASYEFEEDRLYDFALEGKLNGAKEFRWFDGRHFTIAMDGTQFMVDYNGDNLYELTDSYVGLGSFFDKDIDSMFTITKNESDDEDAPAARLNLTHMRTPEDR